MLLTVRQPFARTVTIRMQMEPAVKLQLRRERHQVVHVLQDLVQPVVAQQTFYVQLVPCVKYHLRLVGVSSKPTAYLAFREQLAFPEAHVSSVRLGKSRIRFTQLANRVHLEGPPGATSRRVKVVDQQRIQPSDLIVSRACLLVWSTPIEHRVLRVLRAQDQMRSAPGAYHALGPRSLLWVCVKTVGHHVWSASMEQCVLRVLRAQDQMRSAPVAAGAQEILLPWMATAFHARLAKWQVLIERCVMIYLSSARRSRTCLLF